jgi:hypothetical protein
MCYGALLKQNMYMIAEKHRKRKKREKGGPGRRKGRREEGRARAEGVISDPLVFVSFFFPSSFSA